MPDLSSNNRTQLLELARESIRTFLETGDHLQHQTQDEALCAKQGCFVTLRKDGALRGCVGTFAADQPLYENVMRMAIAAAVQDRRFPKVEKKELVQIKIEISVLGPLFPMNSPAEIEIGKHGVLVKYGNRSGTFLPDVAEEQKWSAEEFIMWCAREKAGLTPAEISKAQVSLYEVIKFAE